MRSIAELQQHKVIVEAEPEEKPFEVVEQIEFPGGIAELNSFCLITVSGNRTRKRYQGRVIIVRGIPYWRYIQR